MQRRTMLRLLPSLLPLSPAWGKEGFAPLFNERNLDEFLVDTPGLWTVESGVLIGRSPGLRYNDFLRTRQHYRDFHFKVQFRMTDPTGDANSGIQFRSKPLEGSHEVIGYQADLGQKYWGCLYDESRRRRVLACPAPEALRTLDKAGWNEYSIHAEGRRIRLSLNGVETVDYTETDTGIDDIGFLAFQLHSGPPFQIEFRQARIRSLGTR